MRFFGQLAQCTDHRLLSRGAVADALERRAIVLQQAHGDHGHAQAVERVDAKRMQHPGRQVAPVGLCDLDVVHRSNSIATGSVLGTPFNSRSNKASACSRVTPAACSNGVNTCSNGSPAKTLA